MHTALPRVLSILLIVLMLCGCASTAEPNLPAAAGQPTAAPNTGSAAEAPAAAGAPAALPTAAPSAEAAPTAEPTLLPTDSPAPTIAPAEAATTLPAPIPAAGEPASASGPAFQALYQCKPGFCRYTQGEEEPQALITALDPALHGYAFTPDGAGIVLAQDAYASSDAEIIVANLDLLDVHTITTVQGAPSGSGGLEGFGVLGMTADGQRVIFEDQAQLFIAQRDGSQRHAIMEQRPYGASSTHEYRLSPSGLRVLYTTSGQPNQFEVADVESGALQSFELTPDRRALAMIDDKRVLIERFDPPYEPEGPNPATISRWSLGYEVVSIDGDRLSQPAVLRPDDGSVTRSLISNIAGDWALIHDDPAIGGDSAEQGSRLWLLNVRTGERQEASLPLYDGYSLVAIALLR